MKQPETGANEARKTELIPKIKEGIVIDHIPAGRGMNVLLAIRSYPGMERELMTVGLNYKSTKFGRKDIVKLATTHLPEEIVEHVALVAPGVSIKRIRDYQVDKKYVIPFPDTIVNKLACRNPNCITNYEKRVTTMFCCFDETKRQVKCRHCERIFLLDELELLQTAD
jgi:aspartate carbamoyltransferase regulatory subunit